MLDHWIQVIESVTSTYLIMLQEQDDLPLPHLQNIVSTFSMGKEKLNLDMITGTAVQPAPLGFWL